MKAIILDLDRTLIHSVSPKKDVIKQQTFTLQLAPKDIYHVYKRPLLDDFFAFCFQNFDQVMVWSSGTEDYVEGILACCQIPILKEKELFRIITRDTFDKHSKDISHILTHPELKESDIFFVDDKLDVIKGLNERCYLIEAEPFNYYEYAGDRYLEYLKTFLASILESLKKVKA